MALDNQIMQKILPRIQGSSETIRKMLEELMKICNSENDNSRYNKFLWADWNNVLINSCELTNGIHLNFESMYVPVGTELMPLDELFAVGDGAKNYNDVLHSSCYKPIYTFRYMKHFWADDGGSLMTHRDSTKFNIGGFTYCLRCGEEECLTGADTMMCEKCELEYGTSENDLFTTCDSCSRRIYTDDVYAVGDEGWCQHCFDKYARRCEVCGEAVYEDQIHYHEPTQQYVCEYCLEDLNEKKENY